jgi:hypothetical protein
MVVLAARASTRPAAHYALLNERVDRRNNSLGSNDDIGCCVLGDEPNEEATLVLSEASVDERTQSSLTN